MIDIIREPITRAQAAARLPVSALLWLIPLGVAIHYIPLLDYLLNFFGQEFFGFLDLPTYSRVVGTAWLFGLGCTGLMLWRGLKRQAGHWYFTNKSALFFAVAAGYLLSAMLWPASKPKIDWQVNARPISVEIEKKQLGVFYNLTKFMNRDEGNYGQYQLRRSEKDTMIVQYLGNTYSVRVPTFQGAIATKISDFPWEERLPEAQPEDPMNCFGRNSSSDTGAARSFNNSLCYQGQTIFRANGARGVFIKEYLLDANGQWLLIAISDVPYAPTTVYLVDLSGITAAKESDV